MLEIEERCAYLLRQLRKKKGFTLRQCEEASGGRFKAVVMGSYERGTRAISLERLQEIADFYEVPIQYFFTQGKVSSAVTSRALIIDLRKLRKTTVVDISVARIAEFLSILAAKRNDWNGELISLRTGDEDMLSFIANDEGIRAKLELYGLLITAKN